MNYSKACEYLESLNHLGSVPGLDTIKELLRLLNNPQNHSRYVHIAGTNGKGSVGAFLSYIYTEAGFKTGRYISPAVADATEIIQINNINIPEEEFAGLIERIMPVCQEMTIDGYPHPTRFEIETAAAFLYFKETDCQIVLLECGMGGILDATNIIPSNECAIITSISLEHTNYLGNTIEEITAQKAGIIKPECPVVALYDATTEAIINNTSKRLNSPLYFVSRNNISDIHMTDSGKLKFNFENHNDIELSLPGKYQTCNAALAIKTADILKHKFPVNDRQMRTGLLKTMWYGRFTKLGDHPDFYIDGAHNPDGAKCLCETLDMLFPDKKLTFITGIFADKDYDKILKSIMPYAKTILTIETPDNPRALSAKKLANYIKKYYDIPVEAMENIKDAVDAALNNTAKDSGIVAFGSLSHLKYIKESYEAYYDK